MAVVEEVEIDHNNLQPFDPNVSPNYNYYLYNYYLCALQKDIYYLD